MISVMLYVWIGEFHGCVPYVCHNQPEIVSRRCCEVSAVHCIDTRTAHINSSFTFRFILWSFTVGFDKFGCHWLAQWPAVCHCVWSALVVVVVVLVSQNMSCQLVDMSADDVGICSQSRWLRCLMVGCVVAVARPTTWPPARSQRCLDATQQ